jgi:hypothetical protein
MTSSWLGRLRDILIHVGQAGMWLGPIIPAGVLLTPEPTPTSQAELEPPGPLHPERLVAADLTGCERELWADLQKRP